MVTTSAPSSARTAAWYPEPVPTSSTRCPGRTAVASQIRATMYGCEIVWPWPMGRAASSYARRRSRSGTKSSRGTHSIARSTSSSTMSRARSWRSTISRRASASSSGGIGDAEMPQRERSQVRDPPRDRPLDADRQDRNLGVRRIKRTVAAAAQMAAAGKIEELDPRRRRDEHVAGVRIRERTPGPLEGVRLVEQREIACGQPGPVGGGEAELLAVAASDRLRVLAVEDDLCRL